MRDEFLHEYIGSGAVDVTLPEAISDRYHVISCLKDTVQSRSFLLKEKHGGKQVLLKLSDVDDESLKNEYALLSSLESDSIPHAYSCVSENGYTYLTRQYVEGQTLDELVQKRERLGKSEAIAVALQLCNILEYLHGQTPPLIHRDIKPQNIIYTPEGLCVLIDFGIARRFKGASSNDTVIMGSAATAAPEQFGFRQTDVRTDIYSLGVLMHFLLTGELERANMTNEIPLCLRRIIRKCMRFDPEDRYRTIGAVKAALLRAIKPVRPWMYPAAAAVIAMGLLFVHFIYQPAHKSMPYNGYGTGELTAEAEAANQESISQGIQSAMESQTDGAEYTGEKGKELDIRDPKLNETYRFKSPEIEAEVCRQLNKEQGMVTLGDLTAIREILLIGSTRINSWSDFSCFGEEIHMSDGTRGTSQGFISTLEDISHMSSLRALVLCNQEIEDVSPLKGLNIQYLALSNNAIGDISPLSSCGELQELVVNGNPLMDISICARMPKLTRLDLGATDIRNIDPLAGTGIRQLDLYACYGLINVDAVQKMQSIESLGLNTIKPEMLEAVCRQKNYTNLTIFESGISDLSVFSGMTRLEGLNIEGNSLTSLHGIQELSGLKMLTVNRNPLQDLKGIEALKHLEFLDMRNLTVTDFSPLSALDSLTEVACSDYQQYHVSQAAKKVKIAVR